MRLIAGLIVIGPLMLIGALPAVGQSISSEPRAQLAAAAEATPGRETYIQQARDQIRARQQKLHDLDAKAEAKGKEAGDTGESDLKAAWSSVQAASDKLQAAGAEDWESAKAAYEKASHELAEAWRRHHPEDK